MTPKKTCCEFLWISFWRAFAFFALTLVAILSEPETDSQSLQTWLLKFIEFISMDCDSLMSLLLSTLFIFCSEVWVKVKDISSVISFGVFESVDKCVLLTHCYVSGTDNDWCWFWVTPSGFLLSVSFSLWVLSENKSDCICMFVGWLFEIAMLSISMYGRIWILA